MLIRFSGNPIKEAAGIIRYNWGRLLTFTLWASLIFVLYNVFGFQSICLPVVPVSILGGALAIFLGFKNSSAYDRWWEARKIWGGIVNSSRTLGIQINAYFAYNQEMENEVELKGVKMEFVNRHLAWLNAMIMQMNGKKQWSDVRAYLSDDEAEEIRETKNKAAQILNLQARALKLVFKSGLIEDFRKYEIMHTLGDFFDHQGKSERIKKTIFPYYYNFFTNLFLWLFVLCLPFGLLEKMDWTLIPMCVAISFVFSILEKTGRVSEAPFEGRAADISVQAIVRGIEIDLKEMMNEENIPEPVQEVTGRYGVQYLP